MFRCVKSGPPRTECGIPGPTPSADRLTPGSFATRCARVAGALCFATAVFSAAAPADTTRPALPPADVIVLPASVPDPLEPVNRVVWEFNKGLLAGVVQPTSKVYRRVVFKPVRTGLGNFDWNLRFPGRFINSCLQGEWKEGGQETWRFLCNTVAGAGGFVDVASKWNIPKTRRDFGQTFGTWGWKPDAFLMLPLAGPSNDRDALGLAGDWAASPLTWVDSPYSYIAAGLTYNGLTDTVDDSVRFTRSEADPYSLIQYAWTFARQNQVADFRVHGKQDLPSLETLQSVFFTFKDPAFPERGKTRSARIPATGKDLKFTFWLQPGKAPVVYIVPGLGSHRLAKQAIALAELVHKQGFSAVCVSSPFNAEFMEHASTAAMPAHPEVDSRDLHAALSEIDRLLESRYAGRLGPKALMGYSMGAFHSLCIAAAPQTNPAAWVKFDRYVAINPPVRLLHAISKLDEFFQAPAEIPAAERTQSIENTFLKVAALSKTTLTPQLTLPFNAVESKFLIGAAFRFTLRDVIFSSQQRRNQQVLQQPLSNLRRTPVYQEILQYSYADYLERFVIPYYQFRGMDLRAPGAMAQAGDLRVHGPALRANGGVRLVVNRNDFLLAKEDVGWLQTTFDSKQLTMFDQGGHLGNLAHPEVQRCILSALDGLKPQTAQK